MIDLIDTTKMQSITRQGVTEIGRGVVKSGNCFEGIYARSIFTFRNTVKDGK
jgi:hypothetical protein